MFPIIPVHLSLRHASLKPATGRCSAATATPPPAPLAAAGYTAPADTAPAPADAAGREVGGAVAQRALPPLARTQPFSARELAKAAAARFPAPVPVRVDAAGALEAADLPPASVGAAARLAPDCQAANALLVLEAAGAAEAGADHGGGGGGPRLAVHTLRAIAPGQHLLLWFSEHLLARLAIPFLSPGNIQANARYQCVECGANFESPNPLKLHLALSCGKLPAHALWDRLLVSPEKPLTQDAAASTGGRTSAFRPYERRASASETRGSGSSPGADLPAFGGLLTSPLAEAAEERLQQHVEAVATSLGRATPAPGHLCVYCGKLYSRKYGLKIHIRTHTGYKPLKCKVCLRAFGDPSNLNKHVRLHAEGQTPYRCDLCGKVLVRRRDLERHLKSRHCTWSSRHDTSCDEVTQRTHFRVAELC